MSSMYYPSAFGGHHLSSNLSFFGAPFEKKHRPGRINPGLTDKSLHWNFDWLFSVPNNKSYLLQLTSSHESTHPKPGRYW